MKSQPSILFIDDDRDFLLAQQAFFGSRGYEVLTADSAESAISVLEKGRPDLIVLDLMMEHFDSGFVLGQRIRQMAHFKTTPIIMLSGVAAATGQRLEADAAKLAAFSKLDAFLDKPVSSRDLLKAIVARLPALPQALAE